jgi:CYTH domain-containing protein
VTNRIAGEGRYARTERQQRWVLGARPDGLDRPVSIVDLYVTGTRLRLRRMEDRDASVYKLGQKVRVTPDSPESVMMTNMYLSEGEYDVLTPLGGAEIRKTRWRWAGGERTLAVDEFGGPLTGLVLAEVELGPDERRLGPPPLSVADVTDDDRFSGGNLSGTTKTELGHLLAEVGVRRPTPASPGRRP